MFEKFSLSSPGMCHLSGSVHSPLLLSSSFLCLLFSTAPFFFSLPCSFLYSDSSVLQTCYSIISFLHLFPFPMITWHAPSLWSTAPLIYYTVHFRPPVLQPPSMCHLSVPPSHPPRGLPQLEAQNETAIVFHVFHSLAIVLITVSCSFSSLAVLPALLPALSFPAPFIDIPARFMRITSIMCITSITVDLYIKGALINRLGSWKMAHARWWEGRLSGGKGKHQWKKSQNEDGLWGTLSRVGFFQLLVVFL